MGSRECLYIILIPLECWEEFADCRWVDHSGYTLLGPLYYWKKGLVLFRNAKILGSLDLGGLRSGEGFRLSLRAGPFTLVQ